MLVSFPGYYWGGVRHDAVPGCDYMFSRWGRMVDGDGERGYGFAVRADLTHEEPIGRSFQYDPGVGGYRDTEYPDSLGPSIPADTDLEWHRISVAVLSERYVEMVDDHVVASGHTTLACGGLYLRVWRATAEFRDLTVTPLT